MMPWEHPQDDSSGGEANANSTSGQRISFEHALMLTSAAVFVCVAILVIVSYFIFAVIVILSSLGAATAECNAEAPIWLFCVVASSLLALQLASGGAKDSEGNIQIIGLLFLASAIALAVWGMGMLVGMSDDCLVMWNEKYGSLLLLFRVSVILMVIQAVLIVCMVLCGTIIVGWMVQTWARANEARHALSANPDGYESIPEPVHGVQATV